MVCALCARVHVDGFPLSEPYLLHNDDPALALPLLASFIEVIPFQFERDYGLRLTFSPFSRCSLGERKSDDLPSRRELSDRRRGRSELPE